MRTSDQQGTELLLAAGQVWLTNVIVFGLAFWELDRGGPAVRAQSSRGDVPPADFRFPQDDDTVAPASATGPVSGWTPSLVDYLYLSLTNSSAFSPTDTLPLTARAKVLMGLQSTAALVVFVLVIAKGVGSLGS